MSFEIAEESVVTNVCLTQKQSMERICTNLAKNDFIFVPADRTATMLADTSPVTPEAWENFQQSWERLAVDTYMGDNGTYRKRRHATLSALPASTIFKVEQHQPHYQSLTYNTLNGGILRNYEPIEDGILHGSVMNALVRLGCDIFGRLAPYHPWHIEVHQFRIEAQQGVVGKPTPEGVHRDGVNFEMMLMVSRKNVMHGESTIYDLEKNPIEAFTLHSPMDMAIVNDERVLHGVSSIAPLNSASAAVRDVLVITFRKKH